MQAAGASSITPGHQLSALEIIAPAMGEMVDQVEVRKIPLRFRLREIGQCLHL